MNRPHCQTRSKRHAPRASVVACVLGVLAYLLLPGLHAVHAGDAETHHTHVHAGHVHHHEHSHADHEQESPDEPRHDSESCGVCRVYFATQSGTDLTPTPGVILPACSTVEMIVAWIESPVVSTSAPDRPLRGPPA